MRITISEQDALRYELLFAEIDPEQIAREISLNHQHVFTQFPFPEEVNSERQFFAYIGALYAHLCRGTNRAVLSDIECIEKAREYIQDESEAFKQCTQGLGNAFFDVSKLIYERFHRESVIAYVREKVRKHINSSYEDRERFAYYFCNTRTNYSAQEIKLASFTIAEDVDEFAIFYLNMLERNRHL